MIHRLRTLGIWGLAALAAASVGSQAKAWEPTKTVEIVVAAGGGGGLARISVGDHGIGVPPASLERVFEPFGRAPNAEASQVPGMGLGLFICRSIVERHGGRMWAESPGEGQGTTLIVELPLEARVEPEPYAAQRNAVSALWRALFGAPWQDAEASRRGSLGSAA